MQERQNPTYSEKPAYPIVFTGNRGRTNVGKQIFRSGEDARVYGYLGSFVGEGLEVELRYKHIGSGKETVLEIQKIIRKAHFYWNNILDTQKTAYYTSVDKKGCYLDNVFLKVKLVSNYSRKRPWHNGKDSNRLPGKPAPSV